MHFPHFASRLIAAGCLAWFGNAAAAASITAQPAPVTVARSGVPVSFAVAASGTGTLRYQWRHLGTNLSGATEAVLTLPAPRMADAGWYDVLVTDDTGTIRSRPSRLMVEPAGGYPGAFEVDWSFRPIFESPGLVNAIAPLADGRCYVGGSYSRFGGQRRPGLLRLNSDGTVDETFALDSMAGRGAVGEVLLQDDGRMIVVISGTRLLRLNGDGSIDPSFNAGTGGDAEILAVVRQPDGGLIVGGRFTKLNGVARGHIARLNADGSLDTAFAAGAGFSGDVQCLGVQSDGKIVAGGRFQTYNSANRSGIARLNADGTLDAAFNPGDGFSGYVTALAMQPDGRCVAGGYFWSFNRTTQHNLLRLKADGTLDTSFAVGTGLNSSVNALAMQSDGSVVAVGGFSTYNGSPCRSIVRLTGDGALDPTFDPGGGFDGSVVAVGNGVDGRLWVGGSFASYRGVLAGAVARLAGDGAMEQGAAGDCRAWGAVNRVLAVAGGRWIVEGNFRWVNGTARNGLVRLNGDGSVDPGFDPGTGFNGAVAALVAQGDGKILAAGGFTGFDGATCNRIARLKTDGSMDTTFVTGAGFDKDVNTLALQADGRIVVGGDFWRFNNALRSYLVRLYSDGSRDTLFTGSGPDAAVECLAVQGDGRILAGGRFESYNGITRKYLVRLLSGGDLDTGFIGVNGFNAMVDQVEIGLDDSILVHGVFSRFKDAWCDDLVRLAPTGDLDATFSPSDGLSSMSALMEVQADGRMLVAGSRVGLDGVPRTAVVRLGRDGARESVLVEAGAGAGERSVHFDDDGRLLLTGVAVSSGEQEQCGLVAYVRRSMTFAEWVAQFGLPYAQRDPLAAPTGDGVTNLVKFALGVPPLENATAHLPALVGHPADPQQGNLGLVFGRNAEGRGFVCTLQVSGDLLVWQDVEAVEETLGTNPDGTLLVRIRETAPAGASRRFARLKIALLP